VRKDYLPYFRPFIESDDIEAVVSSMQNGWLTTGPVVQRFETTFAAMSGAKHTVALNSCTAALHLSLLALNVGPGDEVVMPSLSFVAGANCVRQIGAEPVFCDVDAESLCVTPATIEPVLTKRTKAIIPMHFGGRPVGIDEIVSLARRFDVAVIEDAAHAVGTLDTGAWPGVKSDVAAYSFYATKNVTSAEGGMLVTNRADIAERVRVLSLHGMNRDAWRRYQQGGSWRYDVIALGYKYNMPDMLAALGLAQLNKMERLQRKREELALRYLEGLAGLPGVRPASAFLTPPDRHSWCVFAILVDPEEAGVTRDTVIEFMRARHIGTSVHFIPTHLFHAYRDHSQNSLANTERIWQQLLSLPLYPGMSLNDVDDVLDVLSDALSGQASSSHRAR
jgi:dTDP-4-amino-4,6-dideoxygalactose transaminase